MGLGEGRRLFLLMPNISVRMIVDDPTSGQALTIFMTPRIISSPYLWLLVAANHY